MPYYSPAQLKTVEVFPGIRGTMIHTESLTIADFILEAGTQLPEHHHPHEQVSTIISGEFEYVIGGELHRCKAGDVAAIPPNVPHAGTALTECRIIDVFNPPREDYQRLTE